LTAITKWKRVIVKDKTSKKKTERRAAEVEGGRMVEVTRIATGCRRWIGTGAESENETWVLMYLLYRRCAIVRRAKIK
jgi:hypothetical protein